ncbi:hypothetical protein QFC20_003726 [Naganishia adeliensis]|uniref:Uncharacterized protein n=1 Tax=Naganishia adeliensis TaxID=92952 RepID=A0ACC2W8N4_9TREE|nr:hypothetical protein QFC20_003726 [Naganishia adeliensis]
MSDSNSENNAGIVIESIELPDSASGQQNSPVKYARLEHEQHQDNSPLRDDRKRFHSPDRFSPGVEDGKNDEIFRKFRGGHGPKRRKNINLEPGHDFDLALLLGPPPTSHSDKPSDTSRKETDNLEKNLAASTLSSVQPSASEQSNVSTGK